MKKKIILSVCFLLTFSAAIVYSQGYGHCGGYGRVRHGDRHNGYGRNECDYDYGYGFAYGYTGPGSARNAGQYQAVTVSETAALRDETRVTLTGTIVEALGRGEYTFRDATGDIIVEIDRRLWLGLSVSETDQVEISGEIDIERNTILIDVRTIKKI